MTDPTSPIREAIEVAKAHVVGDAEGVLDLDAYVDDFPPETVTALLEAVEAQEVARCTPVGWEALLADEIADKAVERVEVLLSSKGGRG